MKTVRCLLLNWAVLLLVSCQGTVTAQTVITFPDQNLERVIRLELAKPTGVLTPEDSGKLRSLQAGGQNIVNLSGLEWATNLMSLGLSGNSIRDLSPLSGLTNLSYLELRANPLTNHASALIGLRGLTTLFLGDTSLTNINFLRRLPRLDFVNLDRNYISNLAPLAALPNLRGLDLSYNPLTNFAELNALTNLQSLYLSGNSLSNLSELSSLNKLTSLTLYNNQISDLSPLVHLTNLSDLGLSKNPIGDYSVLMGLTNLTSLWLGDNAISNLSFCSNLHALEVLDLSGGHLTDLNDLESLTNLVVLFADYNHLRDIEGIQNLPNLIYVDLLGNMLDLSMGSVASEIIEDLLFRQVHVHYLVQNQVPLISVAPQWAVAKDITSSLVLYIADDITPNSNLVVTAHSSNTTLVPDQNIVIVNAGGVCRMDLTPAANYTGTTEIVLSVKDEAGATNAAVLRVTVIASQPVAIPDPNLEAIIRLQLDKPAGVLGNLDLLGLTYLALFNASVTNLSGLEWATNLTFASIDNSPVSSLLPMVGLPNLFGLHLQSVPSLDLLPLRQMPQLTFLELDNNRIFDLSPLIGLTNLNTLFLRQNVLTNISLLLELPRLTYVDISLNLLNLGISSPAAAVIANLQGRDVVVAHLPQREPPSILVRPEWVITSDKASFMSFGVKDGQVLYQADITVTVKSSNANLIPNENISFGKSASGDWFLQLISMTNQVGSTTITLTATNDVGMGTSATMLATVVTSLPLNIALLGGENLTWATSGGALWFGQTSITHDGVSAAQSGSIQNNQETRMQTTLEGPGVLTFWWKVSSEPFFDWLEFYVNGELQLGRISGETDWQLQTHILPRGSQEVRWRYVKETADSTGWDTAWVDEISYTPLSWLEFIGRSANGQAQLRLHPVLGRVYLLQTSTNLSQWFHLSVVVGTNNSLPFIDSAATSAHRFYRLQELSPNSIRLHDPKRIGNQFQFALQSPPGLRFEIQASTNLVNWVGIRMATNTSGTVIITDSAPPSMPKRFYRALLVVP